MQKYLIAATFLMLTACQEVGLSPEPFDGKKELDKLSGPTVPTMSGSLEENAVAAMDRGDYKTAGVTYQQLIDKAPENESYKVGLAESLRRAGDYPKALKLYEDVVAKNPDSVEALEGKGVVLLDRGDFTEAGKVFAKVMEKDPKRWRTLNGIGILFITHTMTDEALQYFDEALKYSPDNVSVLNNVGLTLAVDRQFDRALDALDRASRAAGTRDQQRYQIDMNKALILAIKGDLDGAEQTASKHLSGAQLYNNMGIYAHLSKDDMMAKSYLNMALSKSPVYYSRAWDNMDALALAGKGGKGGGKSVRVKEGDPVAQKQVEQQQKAEEKAEGLNAAAPAAGKAGDAAPAEEKPANKEKAASKSKAAEGEKDAD